MMSEWLSEVSHPQSKKYGQHWSAKEVAEAFAPRYVMIYALHLTCRTNSEICIATRQSIPLSLGLLLRE